MSKIKKPFGERAFTVVNGFILILLAAICIFPFLNLIATSFSSAAEAAAGRVFMLPVDFTASAYGKALESGDRFFSAAWISLRRLVLGVGVNILLLILTAYPLSKSKQELPGRSFFAWMFIVTMLVQGGLVPGYMVVTWTGIRDTLWALILPGAITAYNLTVMLNFFRNVPKSFEESAAIDGANQWQILFKIYVPMSIPAIATMVVFCSVGHWNDYFGGLIYMTSSDHYPLMTYLQTIITTPPLNDPNMTVGVSDLSSQTYRAAQIVISTLPILIIYPICQRYFVKGMTLGGVKG